MVFSPLQTLSLKRFLFSQGLGFVLLCLFLSLSKEKVSFLLGWALGEGYMALLFFLGIRLLSQKPKGLTLSVIVLKWPLLAFFLYEILKFVEKLNFVIGLSYAVLVFSLSFFIARRRN